MLRNIIFFISVIAVLSGCATKRYNSVPSTPSSTSVALAEAATSVSRSLVQLAEIEQAAHPLAQVAPEPDPNAIGMGQTASIDWSGPIGGLIEQLASSSGYHVRTLGNAPAIPIIVTVNEQNTPVASILRDAAFQAGDRATILVFPQTRVIEVRYETA